MTASERPALTVQRSSTDDAPAIEPMKLGARVREIRRSRNWTLEEASKRTGLARSTLSKIENEQLSPTFEAVQKLAAGLGIDVPQLFVASSERRSSGRRAVTRNNAGRPHPTVTYEHELLCTDLAHKKMVPFKSRVRARDFADFDRWVRHDGEEFLLVLEGGVTLFTEFYEPLDLDVGDSVYYDSGMGHAVVSRGDDDALVLWVNTT